VHFFCQVFTRMKSGECHSEATIAPESCFSRLNLL
jgi:hypothetical protein